MTPLLLPLLLLPLASPLPSPRADTGLLFAGGNNADSSVEFWSPAPNEQHCRLPNLARSMWNGPTLDSVDGKLVACCENSCDQFTGSAWTILQHTVETREWHTSAVVGSNILLVGGYVHPATTEIMPVNGEASQSSFVLSSALRDNHCSIQTGPTTIVLTGGLGSEAVVTEYSNLGPGQAVTTKELPGLTSPRDGHACGMYDKSGAKMLIVTGGYFNFNDLTSTEVYDYSKKTAGSWRSSAPLPSGRRGPRGVSLAGVFHVTGGYDGRQHMTDILAWDPISESWSLAGNMDQAREWHGVTEVSLESVSAFCTAAP